MEDELTYQEIYNDSQMPLSAKKLIQEMEDDWNKSHERVTSVEDDNEDEKKN